MGLFDKRKKSDDFDSPVESIDLSAPAEPEPVPEPAPRALASEEPSRNAQTEREPDLEPEPERDDWVPPSYGINDAIQLMRALPQDNVELVVQVVKRTLESTKVKVAHIIEDASRKQDNIEGRIGVLKREIADFESEIATRKEEIAKLEADHDETSTVKDRLQLAEKLTDPPSSSSASGSSTSASSPRPKPTTGAPPFGKAPPPAPSPGSSSSSSSSLPGGKSTTIVAKK